MHFVLLNKAGYEFAHTITAYLIIDFTERHTSLCNREGPGVSRKTYDNNQTVMCVMNTNDNQSTIDLTRYAEMIKDNTKALDVATGTVFGFQNNLLTLGGKYLLVMELRK